MKNEEYPLVYNNNIFQTKIFILKSLGKKNLVYIIPENQYYCIILLVLH